MAGEAIVPSPEIIKYYANTFPSGTMVSHLTPRAFYKPKVVRKSLKGVSNVPSDEITNHYKGTVPSAAIVSHLTPQDLDPRWSRLVAKDPFMRNLLSKFAANVVSVSTFEGLERRVDCSGCIVEWDAWNDEVVILSSAKLLRFPDGKQRDNFQIIVRLANGEMYVAKEEYVDFYHNIVTLKIWTSAEVKVIDCKGSLELSGDNAAGLKVIALGREFYSCCFLDKIGKLYPEYPYFGCDEMWRSTCCTSQDFEGGPFVTNSGLVVGISLFDGHMHAHPLRVGVILSCLETWKTFGAVVRPWFGFTVVDSDQLPHDAWERLNIPLDESCVLVKEVFRGSPASAEGVCPGDRIVACDSVEIKSVEQYIQMLSDQSTKVSAGYLGNFNAVVQKSRSEDFIVVCADNVDVKDRTFCCCWPQESYWCEKKFGSQENPLMDFSWLESGDLPKESLDEYISLLSS